MPRSSSMRGKSQQSSKKPRALCDATAPGTFVPGARPDYFHAKRPEEDMTEPDVACHDAATLETVPTRYIEGPRIRFAHRRLGLSTGTPLVLLQHSLGQHRCVDPAVVNALAADRPVIAFDNAGVGLSTGQTPDNVATMARDAVDFINVLGLSEVDLLGFSLGGCIARADRGSSTDGWSASSSSSAPRQKVRGAPRRGSPGGVFPNRCTGPSPAAVLHEVVRQPVGRPGVAEADEGAQGRSGQR